MKRALFININGHDILMKMRTSLQEDGVDTCPPNICRSWFIKRNKLQFALLPYFLILGASIYSNHKLVHSILINENLSLNNGVVFARSQHVC